MIDLKPINTLLYQRVSDYVTSIRNERADSKALDLITVHHIIESTFKPFEIARSYSKSNFIVPLSLANLKKDVAWNFAPYISAEIPILNRVKQIKIRIEFSVPTFASYGIIKGDKITERVTIKQELPNSFFVVESNETSDAKLLNHNLADENGQLHSSSLSLKHYSFEKTLEYNDSSELLNESLRIEPFNRVIRATKKEEQVNKKSDSDESVAILERSAAVQLLLKVASFPSNDRRKNPVLKVELINVTGLSNFKERVWRMSCVIFPVIRLEFDQEQLYPTIGSTSDISNGQNDREALLLSLNENSPKGTNALVSFITSPTKELILGTTSIHDTSSLEPVPGPTVADLLSENGVERNLDLLDDQEKAELTASGKVEYIRNLVEAIHLTFPEIPTLHNFQWQAIQRRIKMLLKGNYKGTCHLVKAPTGTGKTLVFMSDALLHHIWTKERVGIAFPTRILNEDMYRRLTKFINSARKAFKSNDITGGLLIGQQDPLYNSISFPETGQQMVQYDICPECGFEGTIYAKQNGTRIVGVCNRPQCGHVIDYMFGSRESSDFLPSIIIATPDKLFYEATASKIAEIYPMRLFGGKYKRCNSCNVAVPYSNLEIERCKRCNSTDFGEVQRSPIMFWIFDEVHSLYGLTGTFLSIFIASLQTYWKRVCKNNLEDLTSETVFSFEVGTATISNEKQLLTELFRVEESKIITTPSEKEYNLAFKQNVNRTRYRILVSVPIAGGISDLASNDMLVSKRILFETSDLQERAAQFLGLEKGTRPYDMNLTYVQRKDMGNTLVRDFQYKTRQVYRHTDHTPFISGDTPTSDLAQYFKRASNGELKNLVANMVISLGLDIKKLNHMIVVSVPESVTEFIQTIGRTGRKKEIPGFVHLLLRPDYPRDIEFYKNFRNMLDDVSGYFDVRVMKRVSVYAARNIFANILRIALTGISDNSNNYVLTANQAVIKISNNPRLKMQLIKDIAMSFSGLDDPQVMDYMKLSNEELNKLMIGWRRLTGRGNYIGTVLNGDQLLLFSLRESEGREISIENSDVLSAELESQRHHSLGLISATLDEYEEDGKDEN